MKNRIIGVCLILLVICFCTFSFYFWFNYFLKFGSDGNTIGTNNSKDSLVLIDENKIYATFKEGIEEPINVEGYKFRVENNGIVGKRYSLELIEISPTQVNDGCTNKTLLRKDELNYQLLYDGKSISKGRLSQIQNGILDERNIDSNKINDYELKIWLNSSSEDNEGKHFHYKVDLKVIK